MPRMPRRKRCTSRRIMAESSGQAKYAWTSFFLMTTPGDPRSMRKLDTASKAEGSVRRESCSQEEVTAFYAIALQEEQISARGVIAGSSTAQMFSSSTSDSESSRIKDAVLSRDCTTSPSAAVSTRRQCEIKGLNRSLRLNLNCGSEQYKDNATMKGATR